VSWFKRGPSLEQRRRAIHLKFLQREFELAESLGIEHEKFGILTIFTVEPCKRDHYDMDVYMTTIRKLHDGTLEYKDSSVPWSLLGRDVARHLRDHDARRRKNIEYALSVKDQVDKGSAPVLMDGWL
jgi:hypothetical protein